MPVDPTVPRQRLDYMIRLCRPTVHITFPDVGQSAIVRALGKSDCGSFLDAAMVEGRTIPEECAYVMFTSGSPGQPKGVMIGYEALHTRLESLVSALGVDDSSAMIALTTPSFDISLAEMLLPLMVGGPLICPGAKARLDPRAIPAFPASRVVLQGTPSYWRIALTVDWEIPRGWTAWSGGETLNANLADRLAGSFVEVWNLYGPTEATIWATAHRVTEIHHKVLIGRPLPLTRIELASERQQPDSVLNSSSELLLGGSCLALGYLSDPRQSALCFVQCNGALWYRTSDFCVWTDDGELDFVSRQDQQVKVSGHRVEIGDVESALNACPGVHEGAVVASHDETRGATILVAYVVSDLTRREVRSRLRQVVPDYMVPSRFHFVDSLPQTPNGKVDRSRLSSGVNSR